MLLAVNIINKYYLIMSVNRAVGMQRVLSKLQESFQAGKYYEAHQMYRTLYFRYLGQKKYSELLDLLHDASGADLAILLVDVMVQAETPTTEENIKKLSQLLFLIGADIPERDTFLSKSIRWSMQGSENKKNYYLARFHFLHSPDGQGCAKMLVELHMARGFASEVDLFITQAVLQYLCLHNKTAAALALSSYTAQHPNIKKKNPPYLLPLLNFLWFLLQAVDSGKLVLFTTLCEQYQPSLGRDPAYREYLEKIAQIFFGVRPPQHNRPRGLFDNLLQSLLGGKDEEESDDEAGCSTSTASQSRPTRQLPMETEDMD
ncbi:hypothetical protein B566_EDAN008695 [Ephemera danica]|nr:hypothetical protein B566_EDAN008695 [Ephemera danica]